MTALLALPVTGVAAGSYGLPDGIQQGNILHCFNWPISEVKASLPSIAAAGFGSVQLSPLQRGDIRTGSSWHDLYRPYDLAFKSSSFCSEQDLKSLCEEAATYGIKVIVDVVANHVDKTAGYHDTWWDANGRVRWEGGINYGDRNSITHGQLGDYGDINSESAEVCARGKAYVEKLKSLGVKGIRWDAAKHIGLPSEGCNFWSSVTSVSGMYHYGEILNEPGPNENIIKEYAQYMSVTDNRYSNGAARDNGGIPQGYGGAWVVNYSVPDTKVVYWGESHDTYSNDEWSQNVDQSVIDRAYASFACRNGATALYLARPKTKGFSNIKVGKGTTAYEGKHIAAVNKFRNAMTGRADWCEANGNTFCVTREDGGAVIVMKGSGNVSVTNGGGYCPAGTYTDMVNGGKFTVTATTISGNVGSSGIAVIMKDGVGPNPNPDPNPDPNPNPNPESVTITGDYNLAYNGSKSNVYYWATGNSPIAWDDAPAMASVKGSDGNTYKVYKLPAGMTNVIFKDGSGQTDDLDYTSQYVMNDNGATTTKVIFKNGNNPGPDPIEGGWNAYFKNSANWGSVYAYVWDANEAGSDSKYFGAWPGKKLELDAVSGYFKASVAIDNAAGKKMMIIFTDNSGNQTDDLEFKNNGIYDLTGHIGEYSSFIQSIGTDENLPAVYYNLQGIQVENPTNGIYIERRGKKARKVVIR